MIRPGSEASVFKLFRSADHFTAPYRLKTDGSCSVPFHGRIHT